MDKKILDRGNDLQHLITNLDECLLGFQNLLSHVSIVEQEGNQMSYLLDFSNHPEFTRRLVKFLEDERDKANQKFKEL